MAEEKSQMKADAKYLLHLIVALSLTATMSVYAQGSPTDSYVRSLGQDGQLIAVIEVVNASGEVVDRVGYARPASQPWQSLSSTRFRVADDLVLQLYGVEPCVGQLVVRDEEYAGDCEDYAQRNLQIMLNNPRALVCRTAAAGRNMAVQLATCDGHYVVAGAMDSVDNLEEQLVSLGALRLAVGNDNQPLRSDLVDAQQIGSGGFGMWADPRHRR